MKVLLLMYQDEKAMQRLPREEYGKLHGAFTAYVDALKQAGALAGNHGLRPTVEAKTVRKQAVLDGPFAETKEQLGGYYIIDCPSLDDAIEAAARIPGARQGRIEIRPIAQLPDMDGPG